MFYNILHLWGIGATLTPAPRVKQSAKGVATSDTPTPAALPSIHFWIGWVGVHGADTIGTEATKEKAPTMIAEASEKTTTRPQRGVRGIVGEV